MYSYKINGHSLNFLKMSGLSVRCLENLLFEFNVVSIFRLNINSNVSILQRTQIEVPYRIFFHLPLVKGNIGTVRAEGALHLVDEFNITDFCSSYYCSKQQTNPLN